METGSETLSTRPIGPGNQRQSIRFVCVYQTLYYVENPVHIPRAGDIVRLPMRDVDYSDWLEYKVLEVRYNYQFPDNLPEWDKHPLYVVPCRSSSIVVILEELPMG